MQVIRWYWNVIWIGIINRRSQWIASLVILVAFGLILQFMLVNKIKNI